RPLTPGSTDYGDWEPFKEARSTGAFTVSPFMVGRISKKHILAVALPLLSPDGEFDGVVAASIDLGWLNQYFADKSLPTDGAMGVTDRNGIILVRVPALPDAIGTPMSEDSRWMLTARQSGTFEATGRDGIERFVGFIPLSAPPRNVLVSVGIGKRAAMAQ